MDKETQYEKFLGVNTADEEVFFGSSMPSSNATYEASEYDGLKLLFDEFPLTAQDTLVDFGCGMGRVLFYCNQRFGCNVVGIEYDAHIFEKLLDNCSYYYVRFKNQENKFSLHQMKAEDYSIKDTDNVFYFFNPFSVDIFQDILEKIIESKNKNLRDITIILYYCTYDYMSLMRKYPAKLKSIIKLPAYRFDPEEKIHVYSL